MSEQSERPKKIRISWVLWGILAVMVAFLASAFSQAWSVHQALKEKEALLDPMLTEQSDRHTTLEAKLTYVQSDTYIEEWAQSNARMSRPDETLVVFIAPTPTATLTPTPTRTPTPTPTASSWQQWWQSVFGE